MSLGDLRKKNQRKNEMERFAEVRPAVMWRQIGHSAQILFIVLLSFCWYHCFQLRLSELETKSERQG